VIDSEWREEEKETHDWLIKTFRDLGVILRVNEPDRQVYARAWMHSDGSVVNFSLHLRGWGFGPADTGPVIDLTVPVSYTVVRRRPDPLQFAVDLLTPIRDAALQHVVPVTRWPKQV
jgi:hypothetical protein